MIEESKRTLEIFKTCTRAVFTYPLNKVGILSDVLFYYSLHITMNLVNALNLEMSYKLFIHLFNKYFQRDSRESEHIFWYQMDPVFNCMTSGKLFNLCVSDSWTVQQLIIVPTPQREHGRQCSTEKVLSKDWEANCKGLFLVALGYLLKVLGSIA